MSEVALHLIVAVTVVIIIIGIIIFVVIKIRSQKEQKFADIPPYFKNMMDYCLNVKNNSSSTYFPNQFNEYFFKEQNSLSIEDFYLSIIANQRQLIEKVLSSQDKQIIQNIKEKFANKNILLSSYESIPQLAKQFNQFIFIHLKDSNSKSTISTESFEVQIQEQFVLKYNLIGFLIKNSQNNDCPFLWYEVAKYDMKSRDDDEIKGMLYSFTQIQTLSNQSTPNKILSLSATFESIVPPISSFNIKREKEQFDQENQYKKEEFDWTNYHKKLNKQWNQGLINYGNTCFFNSAVQMIMHCLDIISWKSKYKSLTLNNLLELKNSTNYSNLNQNLLKIFNSLQFSNKENSKREGNDPVRVISAIIEQSKQNRNQQSIAMDFSQIKRGKEDYQYWVENDSEISFLFQTIIYQGFWCSVCQKTTLKNEEQKYYFNIDSFERNSSIQQALQNLSQKNFMQEPCQKCSNKQQIINGFLKLPQFLYINLDERLMGNIQIQKYLNFKDQLRECEITYGLVGLVCHPTFHYTYVRIQNNSFVHFNDSSVSTSTSHNNYYYPIKGLLYSIINNPDLNITKNAEYILR